MKKVICFLGFYLIVTLIIAQPKGNFIHTDGQSFQKNGKPYYYIGTNYWYGGILASTGEGGNRSRLLNDLDFLKKMGIDNLRILVGAEGPNNEPFRVTPTLQLSPGVYNDTLLDGLDFLLAEMAKRGQYAILYIQNSWDWSGGYSQYLNWNGYGQIPCPMVKPNTWGDFMNYTKQFHHCEKCKAQFADFVQFIIIRKNRYTNIQYTEDTTIMAWELGNEPRAFGSENIPVFEKWLKETSALIKSLDKNHLLTTGTEGQHGCEQSLELFERIHADPNIDYLTMHIWPKNWGWLNINDIPGTIEKSIKNTNEYMNRHYQVARKLNKPLVLEEFGLPRDAHGYSDNEKTTCRDKYFKNAFAQILEHAIKKDVLAGCNFWSYGGNGRPIPNQTYWKRGDCYLDPPVEEQGLNSVYHTDATIQLVKRYNQKIKKVLQ
jgi:mannan endo-1,4-beta-mannosidase